MEFLFNKNTSLANRSTVLEEAATKFLSFKVEISFLFTDESQGIEGLVVPLHRFDDNGEELARPSEDMKDE